MTMQPALHRFVFNQSLFIFKNKNFKCVVHIFSPMQRKVGVEYESLFIFIVQAIQYRYKTTISPPELGLKTWITQ